MNLNCISFIFPTCKKVTEVELDEVEVLLVELLLVLVLVIDVEDELVDEVPGYMWVAQYIAMYYRLIIKIKVKKGA